LDEWGDENYVFTINGIDRKIKSGSYYRYDILVGKQVEISEGGLMSGSEIYRWKDKRPPIFFYADRFWTTYCP